MDALRECIDALTFWNRVRDERHESLAKLAMLRYLDSAGADPAARKAALDDIEAAWATTENSVGGPDMVAKYLAGFDYRVPKRARGA